MRFRVQHQDFTLSWEDEASLVEIEVVYSTAHKPENEQVEQVMTISELAKLDRDERLSYLVNLLSKLL